MEGNPVMYQIFRHAQSSLEGSQENEQVRGSGLIRNSQSYGYLSTMSLLLCVYVADLNWVKVM